MIHLLASASTREDLTRIATIVAGFMLAILVVGSLGLWLYRRHKRIAASNEPAWTFEDLRQLRERGEITEREYHALRAALVGAYTGEGGQAGQSSAGGVIFRPEDESGTVVWEAPSPFSQRDSSEDERKRADRGG